MGRVPGVLHWHEVGVEPPRRVRHEHDDGRKQVRRDSESLSRDSKIDFSKRAQNDCAAGRSRGSRELGGCLSSGRCLRMLRNVPTTLSSIDSQLLAGSAVVHLCASGRVLHGAGQSKWQVELEFGSYEQYDAQRHDALKRRSYAYRGTGSEGFIHHTTWLKPLALVFHSHPIHGHAQRSLSVFSPSLSTSCCSSSSSLS